MTLKEQLHFVFDMANECKKNADNSMDSDNDVWYARYVAYRDVYESLVALDNVRRQMLGVKYE